MYQNRRYTPEEITRMMHELLDDGWTFRYRISGPLTGWWFKPGDRRFGYRRGDPKPFTLALISAWEFRQYVLGETA